MAKAHSLYLSVGTPIASAATSSSRIAAQYRPTREWFRRRMIKIMMIRNRNVVR
jgi:hypothetical protein